MKISQPIPNPKIADYVERILVMEDFRVVNPFVLPLYANGSPTLLFQTAKGQIKNSSNNLTLFGQTVFPENLLIKDDFTLIAYFFKPFALYALFGVSAQELTDNPIDLNLLSPAKTYGFEERLLNAQSVAARMALLDDYVYNLIIKTKVDCELIKYATLSIAGNSAKDALVKVQKELYVTERTFQRLFERNIGLPPNLFRRICQFNAAFQQLNNRNFNKLTDVALGNGYADQSHFIRSFKEFTHITPKAYLNFGSED
ncbi:helix-turn-helix domain-containing protein [Pedobacter sp. ASV12]|uniref:helix-turn-helix domain-containing protein n=1 Tax=Pedobacter sp. ASV12 TaxID=2795120 RepID=UPI0018EA4AD5|nr:helix-turn-helix domain-containing protein [Pedobacter sp. ASV12]